MTLGLKREKSPVLLFHLGFTYNQAFFIVKMLRSLPNRDFALLDAWFIVKLNHGKGGAFVTLVHGSQW